jgi:membrane protein YdbS with pleckstrin-like domain
MPKDDDRIYKKVPFTLFRTRKAFWVEYLCGVVILILLLVSFFQVVVLTVKAQIFLLIISLAILGYAEINRIMLRYRVTEDKLIVINGWLKQDKKNLYFHALGFIPDINIKQGRIQRILGYGTIFVASGGTITLEVKDVAHPLLVMEMIEDLIENSKHPDRKKA